MNFWPFYKEILHPVRQELVNDIALKTSAWIPKDPALNHLRHVPIDKLKGTRGNLGKH
jgi:hypothetical protein